MPDAAEITYENEMLTHPFYEYLQVYPQSGIQNVTLTATGGQQTIFQIPTQTVMNLAKSYVEFDFTAPNLTGAYNWLFTNGFTFWNYLKFGTLSQMQFVDIYDFHYYMNMVSRQCFKLQDMLTWDKFGFITADTHLVSGFFEGLHASNVIDGGIYRPDSYNSNGVTSFTEAAYVYIGSVVGTAGGAGAVTIRVKLMLDKIPNTIFSVDKNLYFNTQLNMTITWNPTTAMYFTSTNNTNPDAGTAAATTADINNLTLWLACDKNPATMAYTANKVNSGGLRLAIPWLKNQIVSTNLGTGQNPIFNIGGADGQYLQKIYYSPSIQGPTPNNYYTHSNMGGMTTTLNFNTYLDSQSLQLGPRIVPKNGDDYMFARDRLRGSCIQSSNEYYYNWCYVEDFTGGSTLFKDEYTDDNVDGVRLTGTDRQFQVKSETTNNSFNHRFFIVTQKVLDVTSSTVILS